MDPHSSASSGAPPPSNSPTLAPPPPLRYYHPPPAPPPPPPHSYGSCPDYYYNNHNNQYHSNNAAAAHSSANTLTPSSTAIAIPVATVALGSVLGLTAAAAVRWLNGGDFILFPPAAALLSNNTTRGSSSNDNSNHDKTPSQDPIIGYPDAITEEEEDYHQQRQYQQQQQLIRDTVQVRSDKQSAMLQRLQDLVERQERMEQEMERTHESMEWMGQLRLSNNHNDPSAPTTAPLLMNIHSDLMAIRNQLERNADPENTALFFTTPKQSPVLLRLTAVLTKLDAVLESTRRQPHNEEDDILPADKNLNPPEGDANSSDSIVATSSSHTVEKSSNNIKDAKWMSTAAPSSSTTNALLGCSAALRHALSVLVSHNEGTKLVAGAQLLYLYVVNVASHPRVPRYRKIYVNNESYQTHVAALQGARELLLAVGFVECPVSPPQHQRWSFQPPPPEQRSTNTNDFAFWEWLPPRKSSLSVQDDEGMDEKKNQEEISVEVVEEPITPSNAPQKPWYDDEEAVYLERLKEATGALVVLKSSHLMTEKNDVLTKVLASAGLVLDVSECAQNALDDCAADQDAATSPDRSCDGIIKDAVTPIRTNCNLSCEDSTPDRPFENARSNPNQLPNVSSSRSQVDPYQTPDSGSILSPPITKNITSLSGTFPILDQDLGPVLELPLPTTPGGTESGQLLQFMTSELVGELDQIPASSTASSIADEAEAALWK